MEVIVKVGTGATKHYSQPKNGKILTDIKEIFNKPEVKLPTNSTLVITKQEDVLFPK